MDYIRKPTVQLQVFEKRQFFYLFEYCLLDPTGTPTGFYPFSLPELRPILGDENCILS